MKAGRRGLSEEDEALWVSFAHRIAPLRGRRGPGRDAVREPAPIVPSPDRSVPARIQTRAIGPAPLAVGHQPAGLDTATWERFHRGRLPQARSLDLHGMTAQAAFQALKSFLRVAHADRARCVEVITGRGGGEGRGVLRRELPIWLNLPDLRPLVLAVAHPHPANPGSVRVLLRKLRS